MKHDTCFRSFVCNYIHCSLVSFTAFWMLGLLLVSLLNGVKVQAANMNETDSCDLSGISSTLPSCCYELQGIALCINGGGSIYSTAENNALIVGTTTNGAAYAVVGSQDDLLQIYYLGSTAYVYARSFNVLPCSGVNLVTAGLLQFLHAEPVIYPYPDAPVGKTLHFYSDSYSGGCPDGFGGGYPDGFSDISADGVFSDDTVGEVTVLGASGEWLEISVHDAVSGGISGYVHWSTVSFGPRDLKPSTVEPTPYIQLPTSYSDQVWTFFKGKGLSDEAVAGIMGNLYAESKLLPNNLENPYEASLNYTDITYTEAVDKDRYSKTEFITDHAGYGLAQWTSDYRKEQLYKMAKDRKVSISDIDIQLELIWEEFNDEFSPLLEYLSRPLTVKQATDMFMKYYAYPEIQNDFIRDMRLSYSLVFYEGYR